MARPQNAPRGLFNKTRIDIGNLELTYNGTNKGLTISNADDTHASALPGSVRIATNPTLVPISNTTGRCIAINTTGTTWLYVAGTSAQPTT
jgi:hypothetical protein